MKLVAAGDLSAFQELVDRYQSDAWRLARRFLGDESEAQDITQESFLKILRAAPGYRPSAKFRTYLFRVVSRLCIDFLSKKRPVTTDSLPDVVDAVEDPEQILVRKESAVAVREALDTLPAKQRLAIILQSYEGLNYHEIAEALDTSTKAVDSLLQRARLSLRERLAGELGTTQQANSLRVSEKSSVKETVG
jgi:RNA polymerase sigma-70 factor (ECF subfamily)